MQVRARSRTYQALDHRNLLTIASDLVHLQTQLSQPELPNWGESATAMQTSNNDSDDTNKLLEEIEVSNCTFANSQ